MNKSKKLTALFTGTAAVLMLTGTSAFAESRHRAETRNDSRSAQQQTQQRDSRSQNDSARTWDRLQAQTQTQTRTYQHNDRSRTYGNNNQRYDRSQTYGNNNQRYDRSQTYGNNQRYDRSQNYDRGRSEAYRFDTRSSSRSYDRGRGDYRGSYGRGPSYHERRTYAGRVERYEPYRGGFRVWIGGAPYPFFVSANLFRHFGIRVGAVLSLGGYWDPLGYYDAYNVAPYAYQTAGDLRGVVENIDYSRGTVVLRDDVSGAFVTAVLRGNDPRLGSMRPGDYVDLNGAWNRAGVFEAYSLASLQPAGGYGYGPGPYDQQYPQQPPY